MCQCIKLLLNFLGLFEITKGTKTITFAEIRYIFYMGFTYLSITSIAVPSVTLMFSSKFNFQIIYQAPYHDK